MPIKAPRICVCGNRVAGDAVCICRQRAKAEADRRRPNANARGYDSKWQRESKAYLAQPENAHCSCGCGRIANMVDHIVPHRGDMKLFWNRNNWAPMTSSPCHSSRKQAFEHRNHKQDY